MLRMIPDWAIYGLGLCLYLVTAKAMSTHADAPTPLPALGPPLQSVRPFDGSLSVTVEPPQSSIGTAFAIDQKGTWLTARHVVDECDQISLYIGAGEAIRTEGYQVDKRSDIALINSKWKREPLASDLSSPRYIGEPGYFFGFPQGRSGEVTGALIGQRQMMVRGRYKSREPVYVWAERGRSRGLKGTLGGLSGGPVLDADGEVIGIVSAQNLRRGRIYTVPPHRLNRYMSDQNLKAKREAIMDNNYGRQADRLRSARRITKVMCHVEDD